MPWIQVSVAATGNNYQQVEDTLLSIGAQSITFKDAADKPILEPRPGETPLWEHAIITGLFDDSHKAEILREQIRQHLDIENLPIEISSLPDQDWERTWMDAFKPMQFGKRLWVCPEHLEPPDPLAVNLRLDPGLAFGTGTHPTTSLCLRWLGDHVKPQSGYRNVLDYGCGSGILAIAALMLGAAAVGAADAVAIELRDGVLPDPGNVSFNGGLGEALMLIVVPRVQSVFVLTTSTLLFRTGVLARWVAYFGHFVALTMLLLPVLSEPMGFGFPIWVAVVSIVFLVTKSDR